MPITTLVKQGAFDADLMNAVNTNFNDCSTLDGAQTITGQKTFTANVVQAVGSYGLLSSKNNITALGNAGNAQNYANGTVLNAEINAITTANANNNSVILPVSVAGMSLVVANFNSSVTISLFPAQNEHINQGANNAAVTIANNNQGVVNCPVAGTWMFSQAALA